VSGNVGELLLGFNRPLVADCGGGSACRKMVQSVTSLA
jgi:hypothetical protein